MADEDDDGALTMPGNLQSHGRIKPRSATWYLNERRNAEASVESARAMTGRPFAPQNICDVMDRRLDRLAEVDDTCDAIVSDLESMGYEVAVEAIRAKYYGSVSWAEIADGMCRDVESLMHHVHGVMGKLPCPYVPPVSHA